MFDFSGNHLRGFDLTKLFIGAEGTLGIATQGTVPPTFNQKADLQVATIRLAPLLPTRVAVCGFPGVEEAVQAVSEITNMGVTLRKFWPCPLDFSVKLIPDGQNVSSCAIP